MRFRPNSLAPKAVTVDGEAVDELAAEFQVSSFVIRHQIQNHELATLPN